METLNELDVMNLATDRLYRDRIRSALNVVNRLADDLPRGDTRADVDMAVGYLADALEGIDTDIATAIGLSDDAITTLKGWEVLGPYVDHWLTPDGLWAGDKCGCQDDRCIGYHHDETAECGCLVPCIETFIGNLEG